MILPHPAATGPLLGLRGLVQRMPYPLMANVGRTADGGCEAARVERIGSVVARAMPIGLVSGGSSGARAGQASRRSIFVAALVRSIWIRTLAWSARGILLLDWNGGALQSPSARSTG